MEKRSIAALKMRAANGHDAIVRAEVWMSYLVARTTGLRVGTGFMRVDCKSYRHSSPFS